MGGKKDLHPVKGKFWKIEASIVVTNVKVFKVKIKKMIFFFSVIYWGVHQSPPVGGRGGPELLRGWMPMLPRGGAGLPADEDGAPPPEGSVGRSSNLS